MTSAQLAFSITNSLLSSEFAPRSTLWVTATTTATVFPPVSPVSGTQPAHTTGSPNASPHVVTEVRTVTTTTTPTVDPPSPSTPTMTRTTWSAPPRMTDLSAFNVSSFHTGKDNLAIVRGIPASASATSAPFSTSSPMTLLDTSSPFSPWDNSTSVLQLRYPANSINPGNRPVGGAQFYAAPLELSDARDVTLRYSAFFPADFDWVLAGKLPGLYGGRTGCSGGDNALDCFSTRLMWRKGGVGELYLYAPKEKQTDALCTHPQSVCDSAYGLSIGRGSFTFARGAWTTVQQNVVLNTPGKQDGSFTLNVNGRRVIERHDVFYRDVASSQSKNKQKKKPKKKKKKKPQKKPQSDPDGDLGDLLDPLLDGLFGRDPVWDRDWNGWDGAGFVLDDVDHLVKGIWDGEHKTEAQDEPDSERAGDNGVKPVGFLGLFFSTFFGGHDPKYATPRDQYVWFKDFALSYNA